MEPRTEDLNLDRIASPYIGPTPLDGGYGWLVLTSAFIYHVTTPGLLTLYGFVILKSLRDEEHDEGAAYKIWEIDIALVPILALVLKLLLESWCRTVVKLFNMPRFMALSGLCLTVAGIFLSSYSTDADSNDNIINVFAGIFIGSGLALTGQQSEVIITHYFRDKLMIAQRLVRIAPSIGQCLLPLLIGFLSTKFTADIIVLIFGAVLMQTCFFLASYTRPVYIEKVLRQTYNKIREAVDDDDEVIFSSRANLSTRETSRARDPQPPTNNEDRVVFSARPDGREIDISDTRRFSSNFVENESQPPESRRFSSNFVENENRFSSDFGNFDISRFTTGYQELRNIQDAQPEPLYRETTVNVQDNISFAVQPDLVQGTTRRTASIRKNLFTIMSMLSDLNFYLYTILHLCTTFSTLMLGVILPAMVWERNTAMNVWGVGCLISVGHGGALCVVLMCVFMPKSLSEKSRLCAAFCATGALGFYGLTLSSSKIVILLSIVFAGFSTSAASVLQQPIYNNILSEFDTTATITSSNTIVASFILIWAVVSNYSYDTCFYISGALQAVTCLVFFVVSFVRR